MLHIRRGLIAATTVTAAIAGALVDPTFKPAVIVENPPRSRRPAF